MGMGMGMGMRRERRCVGRVLSVLLLFIGERLAVKEAWPLERMSSSWSGL
jgi:hypothetical protein